MDKAYILMVTVMRDWVVNEKIDSYELSWQSAGRPFIDQQWGAYRGQIMHDDKSCPEGAPAPLPRDEGRFRYFYPNGKPKLPEGCSGALVVKTTYERVREREKAMESSNAG